MDAPVPSQHLPSVVVVEKETKGEGNNAADQVPSGTTSVPPFPRTLKLEDGVYHLLGLGIRTVSFLNIQVYVGGLYVHEDDLPGLQMAVLKRVVGQQATAATITEREDMKKMLLDGGEKGERVWRELLLDLEHTKWRSAWRIVPTRNTDFQHLRDGFVRGIQARTKTAPHSPASTDITSSSPDVLALTFNDTSFTESLSSFRNIVGIKRSVAKKKTVILHRSAEGALSVLFDPSGRNDGVLSEETLKMGTVTDPRVSALLWLNYLAGDKVASKEARESVVDGVVGMVKRPAGVQLGV
ncbi:hypothetical protein EX30DRAFT_303236 [Ascodesmis nigricans]|uniref:Chalcone isomerase domain-containing protein n=1 Tax=Ascodesmis nigricans TaxID=341454 RepID=A0A4V3SJG9_9PEZI|nr:hypothetical protein EX30DRAFT_303236 [Ascodesmis nigricans]